jgi:hypothetical protein
VEKNELFEETVKTVSCFQNPLAIIDQKQMTQAILT